jgi:acetyltransferase-like isoleucine patch superfamily enzyme
MKRVLGLLDLYFLRIIPGKFAHSVRLKVLKTLGAQLGTGVVIGRGTTVLSPSGLTIGDMASIARDCVLDARGNLKLGSYVLVGFETVILTSTHNFQDPSVPVIHQGMYFLPVEIESNVWIGARSFVMPGSRIRSDTLVGAMSLVNKDLDPHSVYAGIPAKKIRERL